MARSILFLCLILTQSFGIVFGQAQIETEVTSTIEAVTVFPSYAVVGRMAEVELETGEQWLIISELPGTLVEESVRASVEPKDGVRINDVRIETWFLESPADLDVAKLEKEISKLETKNKELDNRIAVLKEKLQFLQSIDVSSASQASESLREGRADTGVWTVTLDFLETNMSEDYNSILQAEIQKGEIAQQIEVLQKQMRRAKTSQPRSQKSIFVRVTAEEKTEAKLRVSYLMREARWSPSYEIRANTEINELELSYFGNIRQKTGEDWLDVDLALSTARPARSAQFPELSPWYLDASFSQVTLDVREVPESPRYVLEAPEAEAAPPSAPPPSIAEAKGISVAFQISGKKQIRSGEDAEKILIMRKNVPVAFEYATVPKLSPYAYLTSKGQNESDYPLLAGDAAVFVDGDYIGKSSLVNVAPNEEFELSLGVDEGIRVERELVKKLVRRTGLLNKKTEEEHVFRIKVKNLKAHPCTITVKDQIPVAREASIEIKEIDIDPEPDEYDEEKGGLEWSVELQPKGDWEITLGFTVFYPKGNRPQGLF